MAASASTPQHNSVAMEAKGGDHGLAEYALANAGGELANGGGQTPAMEAGGALGGHGLAEHAPANGGDQQPPEMEAGDGVAPAQAVAAENTPEGIRALSVVFLRFPAQEIARCRTVCRRWRDTTGMEPFRRRHSEHSCRKPMPLFYFQDPDLVCINLRAVDIHQRVSRPVFRFNRPPSHEVFRVHGSCRGILLLSSGSALYAFNPCTRRWAHVPPLHLDYDIVAFYVTGSYIQGDFQCQVLYHDRLEPDCNYFVYTLGTQGMEAFVPWGLLGRPGSEDDDVLDHVLANGIEPSYKIPPLLIFDFLHWLPQAARDNTSIIRFDIYGESFDLIPPPSIQVDGKDVPVEGGQLFEINEDLAMTVISPESVDVWVRSNITELWNRRYHILLPVEIISLNEGYHHDGTLNAAVFSVAQDRNDLVQCPRILLQCDAQGAVLKSYQLGDHWTFLSRHTIEENLLLHPTILPMQGTDAVGGDPPFLQNQ